jgi:ribosome-binding ATPase YchF (GTP1/OBG family)
MTKQITSKLIDKLYSVYNVTDDCQVYSVNGKVYNDIEKVKAKIKFLKLTKKFKDKEFKILEYKLTI